MRLGARCYCDKMGEDVALQASTGVAHGIGARKRCDAASSAFGKEGTQEDESGVPCPVQALICISFLLPR